MQHRVQTYVTVVDREHLVPEVMALAGEVIRTGGLVAFPTETVYGLGANALDAQAVARIFAAKERPANDPIIVHIADAEELERVAIEVPDLARRLAAAFWPGALTLVLRKHPDIPPAITANQQTVAVRVPAHPVALSLIEEAGVPVGAPSANRFSRPSPTTAAHVVGDLDGRVDVVLDAGRTDIGVESTIVDLTAPVPAVLRPGGVPLEALREYIPALAFRPRYLAETVESAPSPGTLSRHYSPDAELLVFTGGERAVTRMAETAREYQAAGRRVGVMVPDPEAEAFAELAVQVALLGTTGETMAANLFAGMRQLDADGVDVILAHAPEQAGLGLAVWDRLVRAAEGHVIDVR